MNNNFYHISMCGDKVVSVDGPFCTFDAYVAFRRSYYALPNKNDTYFEEKVKAEYDDAVEHGVHHGRLPMSSISFSIVLESCIKKPKDA
jgi:hypothetical protein